MAGSVIDWLLVGLGNPGDGYAATRHNIGFMALVALASELGAELGKSKSWGSFGEARVAGRKVGLLKPSTFMNLSGSAVAGYTANKPVETGRIVVLHDDMDLETGRVQVKSGGGDGGHKGLRSITDHVGPGFLRIRMGIGRPPEFMDPADYVLGRFPKGEAKAVAEMIAKACKAARLIMAEGPARAMNVINRANRNPCSAACAGPERPKGEER
jgi:peptidyl-tRNA hydrolase, PTH1 family